MAETTNIEWADATFNPWIGCTKVSPACDNCYAEAWALRNGYKGMWNGEARHRTSAGNWNQPIRWDSEALREGVRRRVFCASLADVFDNVPPPAWRADLFRLIKNTVALDWLLLTKRIGNATEMLLQATADANRHGAEWDQAPWRHVWLGATVINQAELERDVPKLLNTPARTRFLSIEPILGPIDLTRIQHLKELDWVIAGGESGPAARPLNLDWIRSLRDQCAAAGIAFLFKQWGEWIPVNQVSQHDIAAHYRTHRNPRTCMVGGHEMLRIGKKQAGNALDGELHVVFPKGAA